MINKFIWFIVLLFSIKISSQDKFQNLTMKDRLPSNYINFCFKDSRGFIWIATNNGICRYDGVRFKIFGADNNVYPELKENTFENIFELPSGEILFITGGYKLISYNYKNGKFTNLSEKLLLFHNKSVTNFLKDKSNTFWFTTNEGLIKTNSQFELIKEFKISKSSGLTKNDYRIEIICEDKTGIFWLGMYGGNLLQFNPKAEKYSSKELNKINLPSLQVSEIVSPPNSDYVFIASVGQGLLKININNYSFEKWEFLPGGVNSIPSKQITALCSQNDSILWVGTHDGLSKINLNTKKVINYFHDQQNPYSLINNYIKHLFISHEDILWISTFGGISKYYTFPERFIKVSQNNNSKNTISSNTVNSCLKDKFGNLWLATSKGIDVKASNGNKYYHYDLPKSFKYHKNDEIIKFFVDDDTLWIGTWGGGISRFRLPLNFKPGNKLQFKNFYNHPTDSNSLSSNFIRSFAKNKNGDLFVTTWNGGLNKILSLDKNKNEIKFTRYTSTGDSSKSVASNYIDKIFFDSDDVFWICTSKGLQKIDFNKNLFEMFYINPKDLNDKMNFVSNIIQDKEKNIWVACYDGFACLKKDNVGKYSVNIIYKNSLHGIYSLVEDKNGTIWFSTMFSEIGLYKKETKELKFYSMLEETDGFDFYLGDPIVDINGEIFFCGNSGYLMFNPNTMYENKFIPPIYITSLKIAGEEYSGNTDITNIKEIELSYNQRNLSIEYAALNYFHSLKNEYKYLLEGFDKDWISLGNRTEINYANIRAGKYTLKIIGSNNDGYWNNAGVSLNIIVHPPFWENIYFRMIILAIFGAVVYLVVNSRMKILKSERQKQHLFSELLIKSQEGERKRLAQELHDGLGQNLLVIKNQIDIYRSTDEREEIELDEISDLIKTSIIEVKEISSNLHPHQLERFGLNKSINSMVQKIESVGNIKIETRLDDISGIFSTDDQINIYRIIQESLNNVLKHSDAKKAKVEIRKESKIIYLTIEDYGKGFNIEDASIQNNLFDGFGLKSIKERARLLHGDFNINSSLGNGTTVIITLQIKR